MTTIDEGLLDALRALDTPTVCNALEVVLPKRRGYGYTVEPLVCTRPELGSMVGFARTAQIRAPQVHTSQVHTIQVRVLQICILQVSTSQVSPRKSCPLKIGSSEIGIDKVRVHQICVL